MAKQDDYVRYTVRLPADLYERVQAAAGDKSINAQIIEILDAYLPPVTIGGAEDQLTEAELAKVQHALTLLRELLDAQAAKRLKKSALDSKPSRKA